MPRVYVSLGSNVNAADNIRSATSALAQRYGPLLLSTVYESAPVGFDGANFYNLVVAFDTEEPPEALAAYLRALEARHGRVRSESRFSSRPLDLDLLLYGDAVMTRPGVTVPRPEITEYAFILRPLAEIAPAERHPLNAETYAELWRRFPHGSQRLWPAGLVLDAQA